MEDRESDHLFLTYETDERKGMKPFEPESWLRHFRREHNAKFHKLVRHSSIIHKLQDGWDFGDVYLQARHQHPSMTAKHAEFAGVEAPDWARSLRSSSVVLSLLDRLKNEFRHNFGRSYRLDKAGEN